MLIFVSWFTGGPIWEATSKSNKNKPLRNSETRPQRFNSFWSHWFSTRRVAAQDTRQQGRTNPHGIPSFCACTSRLWKKWAPKIMEVENENGYTWMDHFFHFQMGGRVSGNPNQQKTMAAESTVFVGSQRMRWIESVLDPSTMGLQYRFYQNPYHPWDWYFYLHLPYK